MDKLDKWANEGESENDVSSSATALNAMASVIVYLDKLGLTIAANYIDHARAILIEHVGKE